MDGKRGMRGHELKLRVVGEWDWIDPGWNELGGRRKGSGSQGVAAALGCGLDWDWIGLADGM